MSNLSASTKITLGTVAAVIVFCLSVVQPLAGRIVEKMLGDAERNTRIDMKIQDHDKAIERIQGQVDYIFDATRRIENKLGTNPPPLSEPHR
jgi:hypothetical protein